MAYFSFYSASVPLCFNSMEASIVIIFMDHQLALSRTISSSHSFFLPSTTDRSDENKKFGYIKQKTIYATKNSRYFGLKNIISSGIAYSFLFTSASAVLVDFSPFLWFLLLSRNDTSSSVNIIVLCFDLNAQPIYGKRKWGSPLALTQESSLVAHNSTFLCSVGSPQPNSPPLHPQPRGWF